MRREGDSENLGAGALGGTWLELTVTMGKLARVGGAVTVAKGRYLLNLF